MKKFRSFTAGVVATLMAVSTVGTALAASSRVEYNKAGISLFGENKVLTGESYKAPNGQDVPSVITYVDETGGKTIYLSIRQISELLGIEAPQKLVFMVAFGYPTHEAHIVPLTGETGVKYYLDGQKDYCVPKRSAEEIARYL